MNYCPHCGKPLSEESTYCPNCGKSIGSEAETIPNYSEDIGDSQSSSFLTKKFNPLTTDEPLKPKIIFYIILIGLFLWGWLGSIIEKLFNFSMPAPVALVFVIPAIVSILVMAVLTFVLCWNFLKDRLVFPIATLFISLICSTFCFIVIPIVFIRIIISYLVNKKKRNS